MVIAFGTGHQKVAVLRYFNSVKIRLNFLLTRNVESTPNTYFYAYSGPMITQSDLRAPKSKQ